MSANNKIVDANHSQFVLPGSAEISKCGRSKVATFHKSGDL